jgi:fatty-acyl-CoA synthase
MIPYDWISKWAIYYPDKIAVKEYESGRTLTYNQLNNAANFLSKKFVDEFGLKTGDRVVLLAENSLEHIVLFSVCQKTGLILVPLNFRLAPREIEYQLNDSEPALIITENKFFDKVSHTDSFQKINVKLYLNDVSEIIEREKNVDHQFESIESFDENHPIFILYTSGTTGIPKGALYTHKMLFWNSINTALRLDITSNDRSVSCTPMFHTGGWNVIPTPFLHHGAYVCLTKKFDADTILTLLEEEKASMFMAVPTMLSMMASSDLFEKTNLSSVKYFIIGGEPMPLPLIETWHRKGVPIRQGYGLTEVGPSVTSLHQDDAVRKMGSIGKINFYLKYRIVDDNGFDVKKGEVGEFILKGPSVTPGYWRNPEATKESIKDGWFYTGDLVREDEDGFLYVVDRKKNMFISGGENIYPAEIEKFLYTHPDIEEVAVIGVPDEKWGEVGKAFIRLKEGRTLDIESIKKFCEGNLARYKIPKYFEFVDAIPKNETGKVNRKELLQLHLKSINKSLNNK